MAKKESAAAQPADKVVEPEKVDPKRLERRPRVVSGSKEYHEKYGPEVDAGVEGARRGTLAFSFKLVEGQSIRLDLNDVEADGLERVGLVVKDAPKAKG